MLQSRLEEYRFEGLHVEVAHGVVRLTGEVSRPRHDEAMRIVVAALPAGYRVEDLAALR